MSAVRLRRLQADFQKLQDYVNRHSRVELIATDGNPPERYQLQYQIRSLRQKEDHLEEVDRHLVEITLPLHYPRTPPQCRMLTPIFHPNIAPHAICIGDHWSAGEPLSSIVARIGELIAYQSYNTKSPLNGEAARWTTENVDRLPLDPVCMLVEEAVPTPVRDEPVASLPPATQPAAPWHLTCPACNARIKFGREHLGKRLRCPRCRTVLSVPENEAVA
jgi:ubiquitin-protein ligase